MLIFITCVCSIRVTSSEKVDKGQRYHTDFHLVSIPYPGANYVQEPLCDVCTYALGCEFFKEYRENDHLAEGLRYDWSQVSSHLVFYFCTFIRLNSQWLMQTLIYPLDCAIVS